MLRSKKQPAKLLSHLSDKWIMNNQKFNKGEIKNITCVHITQNLKQGSVTFFVFSQKGCLSMIVNNQRRFVAKVRRRRILCPATEAKHYWPNAAMLDLLPGPTSFARIFGSRLLSSKVCRELRFLLLLLP